MSRTASAGSESLRAVVLLMYGIGRQQSQSTQAGTVILIQPRSSTYPIPAMFISGSFDSHCGFSYFIATIICADKLHSAWPVLGLLQVLAHRLQDGCLIGTSMQVLWIVNRSTMHALQCEKIWLWDVFILTWDDAKQLSGLMASVYE